MDWTRTAVACQKRCRLTLALSGFLAACSREQDEAPAPPVSGAIPPPVLSVLSVTANPSNSLSTVVAFAVAGADSIRVRATGPDGEALETPYAAPGFGTLTVLGLAPRTTYRHALEAVGPGGTARSEGVAFTTGDLPAPLQDLRLHPTGKAPAGYVLTSVNRPGQTGYAIAFDGAGQIRWYRAADAGVSGANACQQPNGNFTMFSGTSLGWQPEFGRHVEFDPGGREVCSFDAGSRYTDPHDLLLTWRDGRIERIHLFGYERRPADLTRIPGGSPDALLAGHQLLRLTADGQQEFLWDAFDHFVLDDWIERPKSMQADANPDFDHPNSLALDVDGNYIVSWRHLSEVDKIDARTGALLWRMGGRNNQFTFVNDPLNGFFAQHSASITSTGTLLLFDNGTRHVPPRSRAVEYALDPVARTATMVFEYRHRPEIFTPYTGNVQRLSNGNTWVVFGGVGHAVEVTSAGDVLWEGVVKDDAAPVVLYRAYRVPSLYVYQAP